MPSVSEVRLGLRRQCVYTDYNTHPFSEKVAYENEIDMAGSDVDAHYTFVVISSSDYSTL